jgi:hypothetical protein
MKDGENTCHARVIVLSLADAIVTKAYAPILVLGAIGGTVIGLIVAKWGRA